MARLVALVITLALHVGVLLLITGHWRPFPSRHEERVATPKPTPAPRASEPADEVAAVLDWTRPPATPARVDAASRTTTRIVVDLEQARAAGREHARRHVDAIRRMRVRQFGDAIGALMDAPPAQGWPALEQLAREGDRAAAQALVELSWHCDERPMAAASYARFADEASRGLDPVAAAFVRAALEQELAHRAAYATRCRESGFGSPRLTMLLRERGVEAGKIPQVGFRETFQAEAAPLQGGPFGAWLDAMAGGDSLDADAWITLLAAADTDPAVAYAMGFCLMSSCAGMPELPAAERARLMRASADAGNVRAARSLAEDQANAGDLASAYGWLLFARWADATGCNPVATTLDLADTLRGIAALEAVLSPGQRQAGEVLGASLIAANAGGTRTVWSCPG